jgi:hypothetical protein
MDNKFAVIKTIFRKYWWAFVIVLCLVFLSLPSGKPANENIPSTYIKTQDTGGTNLDESESEPTQVSQETFQKLYEGEVRYNSKLKEIYAKYTWYQKIPIETDLYFIVFDFEKESFRIRYKEGVNKNNPTILEQALQDIKNIGADPSKYYVINP